MWGGIYTEASYQLNFNTAFSTTRSDVLVHLSQWQYWWWFWFVFIWTFYYLVIAKVVRHRTLKMRPRIATSFRPHGKWGDFIAAIIPTIWCINILCNSNFILRLIEWQTESSLLTIRVRARQWYWVYKFDAKAVIDIFTAPKNVGRNKWVFSTLQDIKLTESYMDLLELRTQNEWIKDYWNNYLLNESTDTKEFINQPLSATKGSVNIGDSAQFNIERNDFTFFFIPSFFYYSNSLLWNQQEISDFIDNTSNRNIFNLHNYALLNSIDHEPANFISLEHEEALSNNNMNNLYSILECGQYYSDIDNFSSIFNNNTIFVNSSTSIDFLENSRFIKRNQGIYTPLRIKKLLFSSENDYSLFSANYGDGLSTIKHKIKPYTTYLTFKQKRYKRKKLINFTTKNVYLDGKKQNLKWKPVLINNRIFIDSELDPTISYKMIKKLKKKDDMLPLVLAKRLLRVKRTLIVPAHINLTVITSSYDIIHSWFIPGLGLKLDCVPGRSTHHTFYIDSVGFYVGQCAEICGRYHHHMPIRVCALPFDHFLTWWYHFGAPKLMFTNNSLDFGFRKYSW